MRVYQHMVDQVQDWLDELLACLNNPLAAAEKRGVAGRKTAEIRVPLVLETPAEAKALVQWAIQRAPRSKGAARSSILRNALVTGVLGAIGIGFLFGGDEQGRPRQPSAAPPFV